MVSPAQVARMQRALARARDLGDRVAIVNLEAQIAAAQAAGKERKESFR